jgi:transposase
LADSADAYVARVGNAMQDCLCKLMDGIYAARKTPKQAGPPMVEPPENAPISAAQKIEVEKLRVLCEQNKDHKHDKLRALAREFLNDWEVILRQVAQPNMPLTNNAAEQILRHWVIARKLSQGTRSEAGTRVVGILASVIETCRARGASPWQFLAQVIAAARIGAQLPTLPVIPGGE